MGLTELADRLGVKPTTPHQWKRRGLMPPPDYTISGILAWDWRTILRWAGLNGKIHSAEAVAQYREVFGEEPQETRLGGANGPAVMPEPEAPAPKRRKANARIGRARG